MQIKLLKDFSHWAFEQPYHFKRLNNIGNFLANMKSSEWKKIHTSQSNAAFSISFLFSLLSVCLIFFSSWFAIKVYLLNCTQVEPCVIALRLKFKYGFKIIHLLKSFECSKHMLTMSSIKMAHNLRRWNED